MENTYRKDWIILRASCHGKMNINLAYWDYFLKKKKGVLSYAAPVKIKMISYLQNLSVFHIPWLSIGYTTHNI